jgi:RNA polymerase sigma-70 factor (ECF subfamily)
MSTSAIPPTVPEGDLADRALIERLREDDLSALETLYNRYAAQVHRTAYGVTHDTVAADDILQDTMLKLYRYAQRIDLDLPLAPWLYRVTVNLAYSWATRSRRHWVSLEQVVDRLTSPTRHAPDHVAENNETAARIHHAIETLPFNQRVVVVLHYLEDMDLAAIGEVLDLPVGTVKSRLYYARENLRHQLGTMDWETGLAHGYA